MKTRPADLSTGEIVATLASGWNLETVTLEYVPLGFGSHHWIAALADGTRRFITADDLCASSLRSHMADSFALLAAAFATAAALRDTVHLPFVIGPIKAASGEILRRVGDRYSLAVFPFLDIAPTEYGEFREPSDRREALALVGHVHNATRRLPVTGLRRDTLAVPHDADLRDALMTLDRPWRAGPFGEPARALLRDKANRIEALLARFAALRETVEADQSDWVISHGETHASNIVRTRTGKLVMVDWDTVAFAPRERDLWNLVNDRTPDWLPYREVTGVRQLSVSAMEAYRLHWDLSEITTYVDWCRSPHERTAEMEIAWKELQGYLRR